jgi:sialate O-acetylesterase
MLFKGGRWSSCYSIALFRFFQIAKIMSAFGFCIHIRRGKVAKTPTSVPNTGMAVSIDIGEWNDIHPVNKKDQGYRQALAARKVAYGENKIVYLGPIYHRLKIVCNLFIMSLKNAGSGLVTRNGKTLNCFEVCVKDGN